MRGNLHSEPQVLGLQSCANLQSCNCHLFHKPLTCCHSSGQSSCHWHEQPEPQSPQSPSCPCSTGKEASNQASAGAAPVPQLAPLSLPCEGTTLSPSSVQVCKSLRPMRTLRCPGLCDWFSSRPIVSAQPITNNEHQPLTFAGMIRQESHSLPLLLSG